VTWWTALTVFEVGWVVAISVTIILERRSPVATFAWISVLAWLPILGIAVYYFFGPRRLRRRKMRLQASAKRIARAARFFDDQVDDERWSGLARAVMSLGEAPPLPAQDIEVFVDGDALYDAIERAIDAAQEHVHLEYYIFDGDEIGTRIRDALIRARKRNVEVRLLLDGIGSVSLANAFLRPLEAAGGQVAFFNPVSGFRPRMANFRTHRKIVVCDGRVGFTGGMNITREHSSRCIEKKAWRDTHMRFEGPAVAALQRVFLPDWYFASGIPEDETAARFFPKSDLPTDKDATLLQVVSSGPDKDIYAVHQFLFGAIAQAQERVWLTTPYFVPDEPTLAALIGAGLRKVDVRILVPARSDNRLADMAARSYFPELARAGVKISEYTPHMLHAKTMVIDRDLGIIGTANFDNRSFRLNFEVIAAAFCRRTNDQLAEAFERDLQHSTQVRVRDIREKALIERFGESCARLLSPLL
jgi:cardiolipin synthase